MMRKRIFFTNDARILLTRANNSDTMVEECREKQRTSKEGVVFEGWNLL